jgi:nicotinate-nucleotide adenylyltransferase
MASLVGIFGGTFDPPHVGHLILASEARARLHLDRLLWVLTPDPPHKQDQPITSLDHRLTMVQLAIAGNPAFELSRVELDRSGPHYALDTVRILAEKDPSADLVYLMGGDSLGDLPSWHRPAELVSMVAFLGVVRRPGDAVDLASLEKSIPGLSAKVRFVDAPLLDIASHEIRSRAAEGRPFRYFLPPAVYGYIIEQHLYAKASSA